MNRIWIKAGICDGEPFVAGTTIRVSVVLALVHAGVSVNEICQKRLPNLMAEDVSACINYYTERKDPSVPTTWGGPPISDLIDSKLGTPVGWASPEDISERRIIPKKINPLSLLYSAQMRRKYEKPIVVLLTLSICSVFVIISSLASLHRKAPRPSIQLSPEIVARIALQQGDDFYKSKRYEMAENAYKHALSIRQKDPLIENNLGMIYQVTNRTSEALTCFQHATEFAPNDSTYHYNLGLLYAKLRSYPDAELQLQKSLELKPDSDTHCNLGSVFFEENQLVAAASQYSKALHLNPKNHIASSNLHDVKVKLNQLAKNH